MELDGREVGSFYSRALEKNRNVLGLINTPLRVSESPRASWRQSGDRRPMSTREQIHSRWLNFPTKEHWPRTARGGYGVRVGASVK